jgi:hypothetical protein
MAGCARGLHLLAAEHGAEGDTGDGLDPVDVLVDKHLEGR